jgi:hypothetical protein
MPLRALVSQLLAKLFNTSVEMPVKNSPSPSNQPLFMRFLPLCTAHCAALDISFPKIFHAKALQSFQTSARRFQHMCGKSAGKSAGVPVAISQLLALLRFAQSPVRRTFAGASSSSGEAGNLEETH